MLCTDGTNVIYIDDTQWDVFLKKNGNICLVKVKAVTHTESLLICPRKLQCSPLLSKIV